MKTVTQELAAILFLIIWAIGVLASHYQFWGIIFPLGYGVEKILAHFNFW